MTAFASLSGVAITQLHLVIPALGLWHADVLLAQAGDVSGPQVLLLSGSTWNCATVRAVDFAGARSVRVVGGAGGWRQNLPAKQYASPVGVPTVTVVSDAALAVGELPPVLDATVPPTVGNAYVRQSGAASGVLQDMQSRGVFQWWVDATGIVQTMSRPSTPITSDFVAESVHGAAGWYRIATEFPADWQPGSTFASVTVSGTISRVEHRIEHGEFWSEAMVS